KRGIWLRNPNALERLAQVDRIAFDKTGTLTTGRPTLAQIEVLRPGQDADAALRLAAALAAWSRHPLSHSLMVATGEDAAGHAATDVHETAGAGLSGRISGRAYRLGSRDFIGAPSHDAALVDTRPATWLADQHGPLARFVFDDTLRADVDLALADLHSAGVGVSL